MLAGDAVETPEMALGLVPEVLDPVDVVPVCHKSLRVIAADVMELRDVQHIVTTEAVGVDDAVRLDLVLVDREKRCRLGVWNDHGMDLAAPLQEPEHWNLAACAPSAPALFDPAKIALVDINLAG